MRNDTILATRQPPHRGKPLGKHLKGTPVFAGATIMGDGRVALILDIVGLAKHTRVMAEGQADARS